jgi:transcriptional regulator of acetoin/glycerol metabolism
LHALAGIEMVAQESPASSASLASVPGDRTMRDAIVSAMAQHEGNVAAVARSLGLHRTQLYRLMKKLGVEVG